MARLPRVNVENALYYVSSWGESEKVLFQEKLDFEGYLGLIRSSKGKYKFRLYAFALLPKSLELLIELHSNSSISAIMHSLNSTYTKQFNSRYQKKGHLFNGRYKSVIFEKNQEYLLDLIKYIHASPQKSGDKQDPKKYQYSSYKFYLEPGSIDLNVYPNIIDEISEVLGLLKDKSGSYFDAISDEKMDELSELLNRKAYIGSGDFVRQIWDKMIFQKQERSRIIRRPSKLFLLIGGITITILGAGSVYLYTEKVGLQLENNALRKEINVVAGRIEVAKQEKSEEYGPNVSETNIVEKDSLLSGSEWEVKLIPINGAAKQEPRSDKLTFRNGTFVSSLFSSDGYSASDYSISVKDDGTIIWESQQTKTDGTTTSWYGVWAGDTMKGVLSENYTGGEKRDFSFVSTGHIRRDGI